MTLSNEHKRRLLILEASRWVGVKEVGGDNKGQLVEMFQRAVDGKADREPYCAAFVFFCIKYIDSICRELTQMWCTHDSRLFQSEHCLTIWHKSPQDSKIKKPVPGSLIVWQFYKNGFPTHAGHIGIVKSVSNTDFIETIEGNTSDPSDQVVREGDGVFIKRRRAMMTTGPMRVLGYLNPWEDFPVGRA